MNAEDDKPADAKVRSPVHRPGEDPEEPLFLARKRVRKLEASLRSANRELYRLSRGKEGYAR